VDDVTPVTLASAPAELERWYRRLVACYPRSFRRQNAEEIIVVLLATADDGQRRPSLAETADLLRGAMRAHLGLTTSPRTVLNAVRLMYLGAVAQLAVLISFLLTIDNLRAGVRAAIVRQNPAISARLLHKAMSELNLDLTLHIVILPICVVGWVLLAWANGRGRPIARVAAIVAFAFDTTIVAAETVARVATYAPVPMVAAGLAWALGVGAVALLLRKQSWAYFEQHAAVR
jgi:hypothetical protein